jgi:phosphopentomutase
LTARGGRPRRRVVVVVCDGLGVGAAPDAASYGDSGADTLGHVLDRVPTLLPNLAALGLLAVLEPPRGGEGGSGARGKAYELSAGKDTTTGHWEMMGLVVERPFPLYPDGFPRDVIGPFERFIGRKVLGNKAASGTVIIEELGPEHLQTGRPILYTSGDSVFQIAAHEEVWPPEKLWEVSRFARSILAGDHAVGRVIARPFVGKPGAFVRTANRRDFTVQPTGETWLDRLVAAGRTVFGVGKIVDIFSGRGITSSVHTRSDAEGVRVTIDAISSGGADLVFTNLVDFDSKYGHRNDPRGFAKNLAGLDALVPELVAALGPEDLLFLTADHGCETTDVSTDHTREYVPFLAAGPRVKRDVALGVRRGFADLAATAGEWLGVPAPRGTSALSELLA